MQAQMEGSQGIGCNAVCGLRPFQAIKWCSSRSRVEHVPQTLNGNTIAGQVGPLQQPSEEAMRLEWEDLSQAARTYLISRLQIGHGSAVFCVTLDVRFFAGHRLASPAEVYCVVHRRVAS